MKTIKEIWKPIDGFEDYEISNLGKVKSLNYKRTGKEKILKPAKNKDGYLLVVLCRNGKRKTFRVNRLVASAFLPNPEGFEQVNHIDEVKTNNCVSNLEFCTPKYNINYGTHNERMVAALTNRQDKSKAVEASRFSDFRTIEFRFCSTMEANRNGYNQGNVAACCRGCFHREGNNRYKGLFWRFAS